MTDLVKDYINQKHDGWSEEEIDWLKSIKDRVQSQSKQEWSQDDESILEDIKEAVGSYYDEGTENIILDWLKPLKDRVKPQWKPSDEYISRLETAINYLDSIGAESSKIVLKNLLEQLKKL